MCAPRLDSCRTAILCPLLIRPFPAITDGDGLMKFADTEATGDASDARVSAAAPSTPALLLLLLVLGGSVLTDLRPAC